MATKKKPKTEDVRPLSERGLELYRATPGHTFEEYVIAALHAARRDKITVLKVSEMMKELVPNFILRELGYDA